MTKNNKFGFTLLELLIVVLIIGILAAIALPQYYYLINSVKVKSQLGILRNIVEAQQRYYLLNGEYSMTNQSSNGDIGENIKTLDIDLPNIDNVTYSMSLNSIILFNHKTDIRIGYTFTDWGKVPAGNFYCYYYYAQFGEKTLPVETKKKICQKVCNNEIQNSFPISAHSGCIIRA